MARGSVRRKGPSIRVSLTEQERVEALQDRISQAARTDGTSTMHAQRRKFAPGYEHVEESVGEWEYTFLERGVRGETFDVNRRIRVHANYKGDPESRNVSIKVDGRVVERAEVPVTQVGNHVAEFFYTRFE